MLVAGEVPNVSSQPVHLPVPIVAIVALSPFANFSGSALGTRYQSIAGPVLSVSSSDDFDVLGAVTSPSVRKAPFEYMPSRDAYLLWLDTATHDVISGSGLSTGSESAATTSAINSDRQEPQGGSRRGTRRSAPEHSGNSRGSSDAGSFGVGRASRPSPTDQAINISIIQGVTTAFLDVYLKQDTIAKEWLQKDAARWIGERGELKRK
jgi:hypothetical protein